MLSEHLRALKYFTCSTFLPLIVNIVAGLLGFIKSLWIPSHQVAVDKYLLD